MRIISLVPSITETLFDFGFTAEEIVGRTKFCIHPAAAKAVQIIGGTKNLNLKLIAALAPDLIIANKEENEKDQVLSLQENFEVLVTNVGNLEDNYYFLKSLGLRLGKQETAQHFNIKIQDIFQQFSIRSKIKAAYLIWKNPYMTVGSDTFIHDILTRLGFVNLFGNLKRYPIISLEDLHAADVIFLSSEPYPFSEKHVLELKPYFPDKKILTVDGEAFSWFGTHPAKCESYYQTLLAK